MIIVEEIVPKAS